MIYLQPEEEGTPELFHYDKAEYRLQVNDILDVRIASLDPQVNQLFNASTLGTMQVAQATAQTGGDLFYITGYSINDSGQVDIPFIGPVQVQGLTLEEARVRVDDGYTIEASLLLLSASDRLVHVVTASWRQEIRAHLKILSR